MSWLVVLGAWTGFALAWWVIAFALVARAQRRHALASPPGRGDTRRMSLFKPLASPIGEKEFERLSRCLESFVEQLDEASEMLIGCHERDLPLVTPFVDRMRERHPDADLRLIPHAGPPENAANPKVWCLRSLARHATGELWYWSDSDIRAPKDKLATLRADYLAHSRENGPGLLTSPYVVERANTSAELLDTLFVNLEFYPGVVLVDRLDLVRFGFGSGMVFEAAAFGDRVDWDYLESCLADDFHLGRLLSPARLSSRRVTTIPASRGWMGAIEHYLRWQKTIRWCRPGGFAAQAIVLPLLGWLAYTAVNPTQPHGWLGIGAVLGMDALAALSICGVVGCRIRWTYLPAVAAWSLIRTLTWLACWLPWPVVWRGRKWWSPYQPPPRRSEVLEPSETPGVE